MIYLIRSAECREKEDGEIEFFLSLKIGYTEDENINVTKNKRLFSLLMGHRTIKLLATIPKATEEHEKKLHYKFKDFLWDGNEWFYYKDEIIDYIRSVTLEELNNLPYSPVSRIRYGLAKEIVSNTIILNNILEKSEKVNKFIEKMINDLGKEISKEDVIVKYLVGNSEINQKDLEKYLFKKSGREIVYSTNDIINQEVSKFMKVYDSYTTMYDKLRCLCEYGLSKEAIKIVLSQISDSDEVKSYYLALGPEKLYSLGYSVTKIKRALGIVVFSEELLYDSIYSEFKVGEKLSLSFIKSKLASIYSSVNYQLTPKASDIVKWFEVKEVSLFDKKEDGSRRRIKAYELIKSKEQEHRNNLKYGN